MDESILHTVKNGLPLAEDDTAFDAELIAIINGIMSTLTQLGVGPHDGYLVIDEDTTWSPLIGGKPYLNFVPSYVTLRTKLVFDPPTNSAVLQCLNENVKELEWRLLQAAEEYRED